MAALNAPSLSGPGPLSGHSLAPVVRARWALLVDAGHAVGLLLGRVEQYVFRLPSLKGMVSPTAQNS